MTKVLKALNINISEVLNFNLRRLMARHHVTIKALSAHMGVSQDRVRFIRTHSHPDYFVRLDYIQAVRQLAR